MIEYKIKLCCKIIKIKLQPPNFCESSNKNDQKIKNVQKNREK